ncbi:toll-interleukin 1 receptor (TIR) domain containing adaptor protein L homeolog [Xenopus laevis]|uniref:Tirap-prov protein n=1 Tax=Xenopus laevis TaxID=8355 RepID=Q6DFE1_XENLA|nr:toll-interleukin 1 receptor (TIR) domain containing adaptor protein L homeolog [Xenopus laevis]AAH76798.1 Tirap-prov protein [Xenopus laevis]
MLGWFKKLVKKDQKTQARSPNPVTSKVSSSSEKPSESRRSHLASAKSSPTLHPIISWPENCIRWSRLYDAYICHSDKDSNYALKLLSYLESQPENLRCFLPMRDMSLGSPIPSEICSGLRNSHCWIMLLTPEFLSDGWCKFQMHQALVESPLSEGRFIPVMINLEMSQYPPELRFMHAIRSRSCDDSVFCQIRNSISSYLIENLQTIDSKMMRQPVSSSNIHENSDETHKSGSSTLEIGDKADESSSNIQKTSYEALTPASGMDRSRSDVLDRSSNMHGKSYKAQESCSNMQKIGPETEISSRDIHERSDKTQEASRQMQAICSDVQEVGKGMKERIGEVQENTGDMQESCKLQGTSMGIESISNKTQDTYFNAQKNFDNKEGSSLKTEHSSHNLKVISCETSEHCSNLKEINNKSQECGFITNDMKNETPEAAKKMHKINCDIQEFSRMGQGRGCQMQDSTNIKEEMINYIQNSNVNTQNVDNSLCINSTDIYTNQEDTQLTNSDRYTREGALALNQMAGSCRWTSSGRETY